MIDFTRSAARVLAANFTLSIVYEAYRATAKEGATPHDSVQGFVAQLPLYAAAALVTALLFARRRYAAQLGLAFCGVVIAISITYYNPVIMMERQPGVVDWIEDLVFTGLLFAAATQLLNELSGSRGETSQVPPPSSSSAGFADVDHRSEPITAGRS